VATHKPGHAAVDAVAIREAVDLLYERMLVDPVLAGMWHGTDMRRLRVHQRAFLLQALGGPALYSGRDMKSAHAGLQITTEQFTAMTGHLIASLRDVGVAPDVVDRAITDIEKLRPLIVGA
jgi:hemoglobin